MSKSSKSSGSSFSYIFGMVLGFTLVVWVMRGLRVLSFIPGWTIWLLLLLSISAGVVMYLHNRRY